MLLKSIISKTITKIEAAIEAAYKEGEAFDESLVKCQLERIIVWENHFTVELKSELKIEIKK